MKRIIVIVLCVAVLLALGACNSIDQNVNISTSQQSNTSPEKVAEKHFKAMLNSDKNTWLSCMGIVSSKISDNAFVLDFPEEIRKEKDKIIFSNYQYVPLTGKDKQVAMNSIAEDWLNGDILGKEVVFKYTYSQITEIGRVTYTMSYENNSTNNWICVVKTNDGWFTASIDLY